MNRTDDTPPLDPIAKREAARTLYETFPDTTYEAVGRELGISERTVQRWSAQDGGWEKLGSPAISARAHALADSIVAEAGPDADADKIHEAGDIVRVETAAKERAAVVAKHRSEWNVVRGLVAEAVRSRDPNKAKLASEVGRALTMAQQGERKAWNLDADESAGGPVVVIDRS